MNTKNIYIYTVNLRLLNHPIIIKTTLLRIWLSYIQKLNNLKQGSDNSKYNQTNFSIHLKKKL